MIATALLEPNLLFDLGVGLYPPLLIETSTDGTGGNAMFSGVPGS
jgi:hypothetical protein